MAIFSASRALSFSRIALFAYVLVIAYASVYPLAGWRDISGSAFAYLQAGLPRYWTWFDVTTNVLAYMPFGLLMVFSLYPSFRGKRAVFFAACCGALLSGSLEMVQAYLPSRVPSILDCLTNLSGTAAGALLGWVLAPSFLDQGFFHRLGQHWFRQEARGILIVLALWPVAQIYPQSFLFGHGQVTPDLSSWLSALTQSPVDISEALRQFLHLDFEQAWQFWFSETIITTLGLAGTVLMLLSLLRKTAPWARLSLSFLFSALLAKTLATGTFFGPENALRWLTPGAIGGLMIGLTLVFGLAYAPSVVQRRWAIMALLLCFFIVNLVPANYYFQFTLRAWSHGKYLNFNGATYLLSMCWPMLALLFLIVPTNRLRHNNVPE
jgi:VanZ family protein